MFQYQFKAISLLVQGIEVSAKAAVEAGGKGFPMRSLQTVAEALKLSDTGVEVLAALIKQSDLLAVSDDGAWLIPASPAIEVEELSVS